MGKARGLTKISCFTKMLVIFTYSCTEEMSSLPIYLTPCHCTWGRSSTYRPGPLMVINLAELGSQPHRLANDRDAHSFLITLQLIPFFFGTYDYTINVMKAKMSTDR